MPGRSVLEVRCRVLTAVLRPAAACALLAAAASTARGQCQYEVTIIQASECPPFGFPPTFGVGLNDDGKVVGYYASGVVGPDRPFIWTTDGGFQSMPPPPGAYEARFNDINNAGQICGTMTIADVGFRGFFYENGQYTELPPLPGGAWSGASALNDAGQVVSFRSIGPGVNPYNAFLWSEAEGFIDLGVMSWGISTARDLNDAGMVTGFTGGSPWSDGFVWQNGELLMLGPIPGGTDSSAGGWGRAQRRPSEARPERGAADIRRQPLSARPSASRFARSYFPTCSLCPSFALSLPFSVPRSCNLLA